MCVKEIFVLFHYLKFRQSNFVTNNQMTTLENENFSQKVRKPVSP